MPAIEVVLKPIKDKKSVESLKKALSKSSIDREAMERAKKRLVQVYGFKSENVIKEEGVHNANK